MEGGRCARLSIFRWFNPFAVKLIALATVAVVVDVARALQRDLVRGLRSAFLLRLLRLRFWGGRFSGFAGEAGVCTADRVHHMTGRSAAGRGTLTGSVR